MSGFHFLFQHLLKRRIADLPHLYLPEHHLEAWKIAELISSFIRATQTEEQRKELILWLNEDDRNYELFQSLTDENFVAGVRSFLKKNAAGSSAWSAHSFSEN